MGWGVGGGDGDGKKDYKVRFGSQKCKFYTLC